MKILAKAGAFVRADFLSPKDLVRHAIALPLLWAVAHGCGLREFTSILSGTLAVPELGSEICGLLGVVYMALYFGTVVFAPMLFMAAGLLQLWEKLSRRRTE